MTISTSVPRSSTPEYSGLSLSPDRLREQEVKSGGRGESRLSGVSAIALGIGFNVPYAVLASLYDYPGILRKPAELALQRFHDGGPAIVLAWYGFTLGALALVPLAVSLSITGERLRRYPALAIGAALAGVMAGLSQAVGLSRWVFVIPSLAASPDKADAARAFDILNAFGGVAIGEHIGQLLTALFVLQLAILQLKEKRRALGATGIAAAFAITAGTGEGLAIALGRNGDVFSFATIAGFLGLSIWLIATGFGLLGSNRRRSDPGI